MKLCDKQKVIVFAIVMSAIGLFAYLNELIDLQGLVTTILGGGALAILGYLLLKRQDVDEEKIGKTMAKLVINCFVSKEKEQIGFELRSDKKLTKVETCALVEGISFKGEIGLPFIERGVTHYRGRDLYRNKTVKWLLVGKSTSTSNKVSYPLLDRITRMIQDGRSHKVTLIVTCNEFQEEKVKSYHLRFNSWNDIEFFEI